jgi:hypothetical protein
MGALTRCVAIALASIALASIAGCNGSAYFRPHAFVPPMRHYRVRYAEPSAHDVLGPEWNLLNFRDGQMRQTPDWVTHARVDEGSGERPQSFPTFDLFAEHARDGSVIFVMTVPLGPSMERRDLRIVAHDFIDELTGSAIAVVRRVRGDASEERLIASRVIEDTEAEVGGADAYLFTLSRGVVGSASVTALRVSTFVLVRPHRHFRGSGLADPERGAPMLLLIALDAAAERYDARRPELDAMLDRLDVRP